MGIVRMGKTAIQRLVTGVRRQEGTPSASQGWRNVPPQTGVPPIELKFELAEDMPQSHDPDNEYTAYIRVWTPAQLSGKGAYVTGTETIKVRDTKEVGYYGDSGQKGSCWLRYDSTGQRFGEINDMECP